ncbi:MAG: hypothetical protein K940chlam6_01375 [Chlamydiae bacterium]|nr:hypothetical protein [Chlamydiota bacterium]
MNKKLLALSLVAMPGLMAQETSETKTTHEQTGYCNTCCCTPCCCVPKPKKCIDCECYTPAFYDLQCDFGFFLDAAFLYWYARETNLSYGLKIQAKERTFVNGTVILPDLVFAPQSYQHLGTQWDPGVRVGAGFNSECDGWDYYLNWTYFHNKKKSSETVPSTYGLGLPPTPNLAAEDEFLLLNPWINASFHDFSTDAPVMTFDKIAAKWRFNFNQIDLELGRKYWLSRCFNLRPYTGLRGAWTKTKFRTKSTRVRSVTNDGDYDISFKDRFRTRNWGAGLLGGIQPNLYFCSNFLLYGNVDVALIWGEFEVKKRENYVQSFTNTVGEQTLDPSYSNSSTNKFFQMNAILDLAIGLRWEESWCCDQYRSALDLGWEHHIWFDHNHRNKTSDFFVGSNGSTVPQENGFRMYDEATGNLGYGGLVIRLRFDF